MMALLNEAGLCFSTFLESNEDELPRGRVYVRCPAEEVGDPSLPPLKTGSIGHSI